MQISQEKITPTTVTFKLFGPQNDGGVNNKSSNKSNLFIINLFNFLLQLPIKKIHLHYREERNQFETMETKIWPYIHSNQYYLSDLRPRTRYLLKFAAENDVGIGDYSIEQLLITERMIAFIFNIYLIN